MPFVSPRPGRSSTIRLLQIAAYVGLIGSSSVLLLKWYTDRRTRKSDYYVKATSQLLASQPMVDLFGPPIYFGNVDLSDKRNVSTESEAHFMIPVIGARNRGMMYTTAVRRFELDHEVLPSEGSNDNTRTPHVVPWTIEKIQVSVDNRPGELAQLPITPITI